MNKLFFMLSGVLLLFSLLYYFRPAHEAQPVSAVSPAQQPTQDLNTALNQAAQQKYDDSIRAIETKFKSGQLTVVDAAAQREAVRMEFEATKSDILSPHKSCPTAQGWLDKAHQPIGYNDTEHFATLFYDLTGCAPGQFIGVHLRNEHDLFTISVKLFKKSANGGYVEIVARPSLQALGKDSFNVAKEMSAGLWQVRGNARFNYNGDADRVEFTEVQ